MNNIIWHVFSKVIDKTTETANINLLRPCAIEYKSNFSINYSELALASMWLLLYFLVI